MLISMNKGLLDFQGNKIICEAVGCYARATEKIQVKAGPQTVVSIFLCKDCIYKFQEAKQT